MSKITEALLDTRYGKGVETVSVIHAAFGETATRCCNGGG